MHSLSFLANRSKSNDPGSIASDKGWVAKMFAGTTPSITVRKQEYEGEARTIFGLRNSSITLEVIAQGSDRNLHVDTEFS